MAYLCFAIEAEWLAQALPLKVMKSEQGLDECIQGSLKHYDHSCVGGA